MHVPPLPNVIVIVLIVPRNSNLIIELVITAAIDLEQPPLSAWFMAGAESRFISGQSLHPSGGAQVGSQLDGC